jgi:hypothetical protein
MAAPVENWRGTKPLVPSTRIAAAKAEPDELEELDVEF